MTSALQKSECCSAVSAAQLSESYSATSVFRLWHVAGVGLEGWGLGLAESTPHFFGVLGFGISFCMHEEQNSGKNYRATTKGQNRFIIFTLFRTFSRFFIIFPQDFPLQNKGL